MSTLICNTACSPSKLLQIIWDMHQLDDLQKARRATAPGVSWSVALLHSVQVVQVQTDLQ